MVTTGCAGVIVGERCFIDLLDQKHLEELVPAKPLFLVIGEGSFEKISGLQTNWLPLQNAGN